MIKSWNTPKTLDNLQRNQQQVNEIATLNAKYSKLSANYNGLTEKHRTALEKLKTLECTEEDNKTLRGAISQANQRTKRRDSRIKNLENSIHDLKGNYGVK
jgi:chromosome segregation ATPase